MEIVRFVARADPVPAPRLGIVLDGQVVDLQAAHFSMTGVPNPSLASAEALRAREDAAELARRVAGWASTQDAPGTRVAAEAVRVLEKFEL